MQQALSSLHAPGCGSSGLFPGGMSEDWRSPSCGSG